MAVRIYEEVNVSDMSKSGLPRLVYSGTPIGERDEMLCLTDMWRAAGAPENKRPAEWQRYEGAQFVEFIAESLNMGTAHIWVSERGQHGGTWAHWQIGLAYAKYLSPEFHAWCNEVVRAHMERRSLPVRAVEGAIALSPLDLDRLAEKMAEGAVRATHGLIVQTMTPRFDNVERRLDWLEKNIRHRRRPSDTTQRQLIRDIAAMGGNCPCCQRRKVVVDDHQKAAGAQFDHYYDVGDNSDTAIWLICTPCHSSFKPLGSVSRSERRPIFDGFQRLRAELPGRQLRLLG